LDRHTLFCTAALPGAVVGFFAGFLIVEYDARSGLREHSYNRRADSARSSGDSGDAAFQRKENPFSRHGKYNTEQHTIGARSVTIRGCVDPIRGQNPRTPETDCWKPGRFQRSVRDAIALPAHSVRGPSLQLLRSRHLQRSAPRRAGRRRQHPPIGDDWNLRARLWHLFREEFLLPAANLHPQSPYVRLLLWRRRCDSPWIQYAESRTLSARRLTIADRNKYQKSACADCTHLESVAHPRRRAADRRARFWPALQRWTSVDLRLPCFQATKLPHKT